MKLFPAHFGARKREDSDSAPPPADETENESRADVFNLIPPRAADKYERPDQVETAETVRHAEGRDVRAVNAMDLSRLSIDDDGRLYWDGKPVEVRRRLAMSPAQIAAAIVVAVFVAVGAMGSALQATATVHEWSCRVGLTNFCAPPAPAPQPPARVDIPA